MKTIATVSAVLLLAVPALAETQYLEEPATHTRFNKNPEVGGKPFECLGSGVRKKAIFKVYSVVFCMEKEKASSLISGYYTASQLGRGGSGKEVVEPKDDARLYKFIVDAPAEKVAELVFVRDVGKEKMQDSFTESLTKALGKSESPRIEKFVNLLDRDLKKGDRIAIHTKPDGEILLELNGDPRHLTDEKLAKAIWIAYLGPDTVSPSLKESVGRGAAQLRAD